MQSKYSRYLLILITITTVELALGSGICSAQFFGIGRRAAQPKSIANTSVPNTSCDFPGCPPKWPYGVYHESWRRWPQPLSAYSTTPKLSPFVRPEGAPALDVPNVELPLPKDETSVSPRKRSNLPETTISGGNVEEIIPSPPALDDNLDPTEELSEGLPTDLVPDEGGTGIAEPDAGSTIDTTPETDGGLFEDLDSDTDTGLPGADPAGDPGFDELPSEGDEDDMLDFDELGTAEPSDVPTRDRRISLNNRGRRFATPARQVPRNHGSVATAPAKADPAKTVELAATATNVANPLRHLHEQQPADEVETKMPERTIQQAAHMSTLHQLSDTPLAAEPLADEHLGRFDDGPDDRTLDRRNGNLDLRREGRRDRIRRSSSVRYGDLDYRSRRSRDNVYHDDRYFDDRYRDSRHRRDRFDDRRLSQDDDYYRDDRRPYGRERDVRLRDDEQFTAYRNGSRRDYDGYGSRDRRVELDRDFDSDRRRESARQSRGRTAVRELHTDTMDLATKANEHDAPVRQRASRISNPTKAKAALWKPVTKQAAPKQEAPQAVTSKTAAKRAATKKNASNPLRQ